MARAGHWNRDGEPDGWKRRPAPASPSSELLRRAPRRRGRRRRVKYSPAPVEFLRYRCIECGAEVECTTRPSQWPICWERGCRGALLLLPADEAQRRRWADEIAHVAGLERERAQVKLFARDSAGQEVAR